MAQAEYTETLTVKVSKEQKEFWKKQQPNPSKWLRQLIEKEKNKSRLER